MKVKITKRLMEASFEDKVKAIMKTGKSRESAEKIAGSIVQKMKKQGKESNQQKEDTYKKQIEEAKKILSQFVYSRGTKEPAKAITKEDYCPDFFYDKKEKKNFEEAEFKGRKVELDKPFRTPDGPKKFSVYVKDGDKVKKVNFGDPNMEIKRDDPESRKNFRSRHKCDQKKDKTTAGYWSCKFWSSKDVSDLLK